MFINKKRAGVTCGSNGEKSCEDWVWLGDWASRRDKRDNWLMGPFKADGSPVDSDGALTPEICYEQATLANPQSALAWLRLGDALGKRATDSKDLKERQIGCYIKAKECHQSTARIKSDVWTALGVLLKEGESIPGLQQSTPKCCFLEAIRADSSNISPLVHLISEPGERNERLVRILANVALLTETLEVERLV